MELNTYKSLLCVGVTHPDIAKTLVDPLFAARKEGVSMVDNFSVFKSPLYAKGEERVVERSKDRVSKICERLGGVVFI
ncbi:hypothetical protein GCM10027049_28170 [Mucilaginibacter puniceus]